MNKSKLGISEDILDVLMPVFNAESYLREALESIVMQTFSGWKLLIINDGSTDNSLRIIEEYARGDSRILFRTRENIGLVHTLNELVEWSNAPYIARMDADDISLPNRFERQLERFRNDPLVSIVGSWVTLFGSKSETWHFRRSDPQIRICSMFGSCSLLHASLLCKREVFESYPFDMEYKHLEDFDFLSRIICQGKFKMAVVGQPLYLYRQHAESVVYQNIQHRKNELNKAFAKHVEEMGVTLNEQEFEYYLCFAKCSFVSSDKIDNIGYVFKKVSDLIRNKIEDVDREFDYRWLRFCLKNLPAGQMGSFYKKYVNRQDFIFFESK
jgi:glycosyltransferase involved in cell wall biosynthesis